MEMTQGLINAALSLAFGALGWFARELWAAVNELKSDLAKLREELPKDYISRDDYRGDIRELKEMLNRIFDRLDNKQDKP
jgi:cell division protein FtsB